MAEKKYLNLEGLQDVANHVNTRLKTVTTIPVSADNGAVRLYVGETTSTYTKGHIYQYNSTDSEWVDITGSADYTAGNGIDITDNEISVETNIFTGTTAEWNTLSLVEKQAYDICNITDDVSENNYYTESEVDALLDEKLSYADNGILGAKNFLNNTATSQTINNVAFTVNSDDKTVDVTRTAEQTVIATMDLYVVSDEDYKLLAGKTLLMTGCPSGGSNDTYYLECYYNDGTGHWLRDIGDGLTITFPATKPTTIKFLIGIKVASVVPSGGLKFKPMLRLASDTDSTYQPYAMTNKGLTDLLKIKSKEISSGLTIAAGAVEQVSDSTLKGKIFSGYSIYSVVNYNISVTQAYSGSDGIVIAIKNNGNSSITTGKITVYYAG